MNEASSAMTDLKTLIASTLTILLLSCAGCSSNKEATNEPAGEQTAAPESGTTEAEMVVGRATWYGPGLYGNKTASGEILKKNTLTAAHGQLPLGTKVKVTREDTKESVVVVINDRKPFKQGTVIDLAHGAAEELDLDDDGEAMVSLEVVD